ncbi:zn 2cys6 transcription factor [Seiridium cupressi]
MNSSETDLPPPPGPSKTFSIDFSMPAEEEPAASFDELREQHETFLDGLVPSSEEEEDPSTIPASSGQAFNFASLPTPASAASPGSRPMVSLGIKPQFNLDSAQNLLQTFRGMLPSCPCIVLGEGTNVKAMARDSPFVLLAILAATSCSTSLQGHSLYDEEFRKVLGLKFVTGGERTLDLLQGILVYCAWYPFHLRPKHRQAFQYLKMAIDIARDLELDQEQAFAARLQTGPNLEDLASFRALVSCYYLITNNIKEDHVLVWLVRLHHISDEMLVLQKSYKKAGSGSELRRRLIRKGLETQLREWQSRIPTSIALMPSVMMASLFDDMHLIAAPLMLTVAPRSASADVPLDPTGLMEAVHTVRAFFEFIVSLPPGAMSQFCSADWVRVIMANILGYRLCLPIEICPEFDSAQARQAFDFGSYLEKLCGDPTEGEAAPGGKKTDVCTAFCVVLRSLKAKFEKKLAAAIAKEEIKRKAQECPMFDGSLDDYISLWDGHGMPAGSSSYPTSQSSMSGVLTEAITDLSPGTTESAKSSVYHDLWATMTLGWSAEDMPDLGMSNAQMDW